jgi:hypothetical protein
MVAKHQLNRPREPVSIEAEDENEYDDEQGFACRYAGN